MKDLSIYIHIPFCVRKCQYCDFLSFPGDILQQTRYMQALKKELETAADIYREYRVCTVFIGGGTPSVVEPEWIGRLLGCLREKYSLSPGAEISMELNPGTVTRENIEQYKEAGVNRISIGMQSGDAEELAALGRIHSFEDFQQTYRWVCEAGFSNINVDIMSALPGQTVCSYERTLDKVLSLLPQPGHLSAYSLIVEEGTPFYEKHKKGLLPLPGEEVEREMYKLTEEKLLKSGYLRYEISNYAKPGFACRHNTVYWTRGNYAGFGLGAASLVENVRFSAETDWEAYLRRAEEGSRPEKGEPLTVQEQMEEFMFLGLRLTEGIQETHFRELFGREIEEVYGEVIDRHVSQGLLQRKEGIRLTKKGLDVSNYVFADFLF